MPVLIAEESAVPTTSATIVACQTEPVPAAGVIEFEVHVRPRAARSAVAGVHDGVLALRVSAPPADGQANDAVIDLLAATFHVRSSAVEIVRGASARRKLVRIRGDVEQLTSRLRDSGATLT
jgi:uncharacterized protein